MILKKSRKIIQLGIAFVLMFSMSLNAFALGTEPPLLGGNLTWNIESIYYYVDSSANSYVTPIASAANNWVYTGYGYNRLYPNRRTTNVSNSAIDIFGYNSNDNTNGFTAFFARTNGTSGSEY
jgi:hypothetical protein